MSAERVGAFVGRTLGLVIVAGAIGVVVVLGLLAVGCALGLVIWAMRWTGGF